MNKEIFDKENVFGLGEPNVNYAKYFIGNSYLNPLTNPKECNLFLANVTFEPGCRNNWHIHHASFGGGQILICTAGYGWYQEEGKDAISLEPGMVITIPANVKHWHGAKKDSWFSHNVELENYLKLYKYVRDNMTNPLWLGTFTKDEIIDILNHDGKIWLYYDRDKLVCSMFYIPANDKSLRKHNILSSEIITGSLGPIMVSPDYQGNNLQNQMLKVFDEYCLSINKKYIFTKVHKDNIYSINNLIKNNYKVTHEYENERGMNLALVKEL